MDTAVEQAEAGRTVRVTAVRAARQSRELQRGFLVTVFFAVVLGANLLIGAVVVFRGMQSQFGAEGPAAHTTKITRPMLDGTFCRNVVLDNRSAQTITDKVELCGPRSSGKSEFSWGGK